MLAVVAVGVFGAVPAWRTENWHPFVPHGWSAIGAAAAPLMMSFVGWEAAAPLTSRLANPRRDLPRIVTITIIVTSLVYLTLAAMTIAALPHPTDADAPVAALLVIAIGPAGVAVAAAASVILAIGTINTYVTGATTLAPSRWLYLVMLAVGTTLVTLLGTGILTLSAMVAVPSIMFLLVYLTSTISAARLLTGRVRVIAMICVAVVLVVLAFAGLAAIPALLVAALGWLTGRKRSSSREPPEHRSVPA